MSDARSAAPGSSGRPAIDVSDLPGFGLGHREPIWWGVLCLLAIEGTGFVLIFATYFYIRGNEATQWPSTGVPLSTYASAIVGAVLLVVSAFTMFRTDRAARSASIPGTKLWLGLSIVVGVAFVAVRAWELSTLPFRWDSHAYGSVVWVTLCMHLFHAVAATGENAALLAVLLFKPVEKHHLSDIDANGFYWYFVVVSGFVVYALLYLDPRVLGALR